jgi:hypothetical protein
MLEGMKYQNEKRKKSISQKKRSNIAAVNKSKKRKIYKKRPIKDYSTVILLTEEIDEEES